jgi:hypothetical protein
MGHELYLLDNAGNPAIAINGKPVGGPLAGWRGLSYTPTGGAIDKVSQNRVSIPLSDWRNVAVAEGTVIKVVDTSLLTQDTEATRGPVLTIDQSVDDKGVHWANVTFADQLYDLSRADTTTGFATSQNETLTTTITRLLSLVDSAWTGQNDVTGLDGISFTVAAQSIAQAFGNLAQQRFSHFRRETVNGNPRNLHFSGFGLPFLANALPVWFVAPGVNPTAAAGNANMRQMFAPRFARKGEVRNSITPTGSGSGTAQLRLRLLYGRTDYAAYNPLYPVQRRVQQAASTSDGYDYYIEDAASVAKYGRTRGPFSEPNIGAVVNSAGGVSAVDEFAAAVSLYQAAVASLKRTKDPILELSFTTPGTSDIRNIGGMTVHVKYDGWAFDHGSARRTRSSPSMPTIPCSTLYAPSRMTGRRWTRSRSRQRGST